MDDSHELRPSLQISFYERLKLIRGRYLHEALSREIRELDIRKIDRELSRFSSKRCLNVLAQVGVRGEIFYPVPLLLTANPFLLGYYRLLYGFSQKEFYKRQFFGAFKGMEELGRISANNEPRIGELCVSCARIASDLISGIDDHSLDTVRDLQILTLGPQFRGSQNTQLGRDATLEVYQLLRQILGKYVKKQTKRSFLIVNDSGREVSIEFGSDPDISVEERLSKSNRLLVSIEIKGGSDYSNIHNRLGEAEKSHQKARELGSNERWTILRVDISETRAKRASPSTTAFFNLDAIQIPDSEQALAFMDKLSSVLGIRISD